MKNRPGKSPMGRSLHGKSVVHFLPKYFPGRIIFCINPPGGLGEIPGGVRNNFPKGNPPKEISRYVHWNAQQPFQNTVLSVNAYVVSSFLGTVWGIPFYTKWTSLRICSYHPSKGDILPYPRTRNPRHNTLFCLDRMTPARNPTYTIRRDTIRSFALFGRDS